MTRRRLTDKRIADLCAKANRYTVPDPEQRGFYVRVSSGGSKTFVVVTRDPFGRQIWTTVGGTELGITEARERARQIIKRVKAGQPGIAPPRTKPDSFKAVAENWIKRHVEKEKLRSQYEIKRSLAKYVYPHWADRDFVSIRRTDIARLADHIEDEHGPRMADLTIGHVRQVANWYATRDDDYSSPFVKGMNRAKNGKRDRILSDGEIRSLWRQTENNGTFGAIVRLALLTAQRREKVVAMRWAAISVDGVWTVSVDERQKGTGGALRLPQTAIDIIRAQHRIEGNPFVFAGRGGSHFGGVSRHKAALDAKLHFTKPWVIHDLRRTARSLMARAGVSSEHAERVMGHAIAGVEGVYDRHSYNDEKADALARLAALIDDIVNGTPDKIVRLKPKARVNA